MIVGFLAAVLVPPDHPHLVEVGALPSLHRETLAPKLRSLEIILDPRHAELARNNLAELLPAAPSERDPEFLVYAPVSERDRAVERRWKERIERAFTQANPYGDLTRIEEWRLAIDSVPQGDEYAVNDVLGRLFAWRHLGSVIAGADLRPGKRTWTASHAALPGDADLVIREETRTLWREATQYARTRLGDVTPVAAIDGASIRVGQWNDVEAYRRGMTEENFERAPKEYATAELLNVHCGVAGASYSHWPLVMSVRPE
jgi:hypothetical protein